MKKLFITLLKKRRSLLLIIILRAAISAVSVYVPLLILPGFLTALMAGETTNALLRLSAFLLSTVIFVPIYQIVDSFLTKNSITFNDALTRNLYEKTMKVPYPFLQKGNARADIQQATEILYYDFDYSDAVLMFADIVEKCVYILSSLYIVNLFTHASLLVFLLLPLLIGISLLTFFHKVVESKINSLISWHGNIEKTFAYFKDEIVYNFSAYPSFHIFNMFQYLNKKMERNSNENIRYFTKSRKLSNCNNIIMSIVSSISAFCSFFIIIKQAKNGIIQAAEVLTQIQVLTYFYTSIFMMLNTFQTLKRSIPYLEIVENILSWDEENLEGLAFPREQLCWEFKNVSYTYDGSETEALSDLNFTLSGKSINALVGKNGSGKTTLVLLLSGLIQPTAGTIIFNGIDLQKIDMNVYRKMLSIIFQDSELFPLSLQENIFFAKEDCSIKDIYASENFLSKVKNEENIAALNLSGGETQKILIHRALARKTPALILDEPNAALDVHAEEALYTSLIQEAKDRFVLFITHRMRSCRDCDTVYVLDKGKLVGSGTHTALLKTCPVYHELWDSQLQLYSDVSKRNDD